MLEARIAAHRPHVRPALPGDPLELFIRKVELAAATLAPVRSVAGISKAVLEFLEAHGLPESIVVGTDPLLERVRWSNRLAVARRRAEASDATSVTTAFAGNAETGTVVLLSDPTSPTTLNFLPENHIVVLERSRILPWTEDVWARVRAERGDLPRAVNLITGPSRTGDVELQLEFGAHGPRRVHVLLLGAPRAPRRARPRPA